MTRAYTVEKASRHAPVEVLSAYKFECGNQWAATGCVGGGLSAAVCHLLGPEKNLSRKGVQAKPPFPRIRRGAD